MNTPTGSNKTLRSLAAQKGKVFKPQSAKDSIVRGPLPSTTSLVNEAWRNKEQAEKLNPTGIFKPLAPKVAKPPQPKAAVLAKSAEEPKKPRFRPNRNEMAVLGAGALANSIGSVAVDEVKDVRRAGFFLPKQAKTLRWARPLRAGGMAGMVASAGMFGHRVGKETKQQQLAKSIDKFTAKDRKQLERKRAINPAISAVAAGASLGALGANVGGLALRNKGQKRVFDEKSNDFQWKNKEGATPKQMKLARMGSKLQAKALPTSLVAGGIGAAAALNGIQMSHLWNKKDKVYTHVKNDVKKSYDPEANYRRGRRRQSNFALAGGSASLAGAGVLGSLGGQSAFQGVVQRKAGKEQLGAAHVVQGNAAKAYAASSAVAMKRKKDTASQAREFKEAGDKLVARAAELGTAGKTNTALSRSSFIRAGKYGAGALGAAAVGGGLMALSNKRRKEATSPRVFRRRTWNEPVLGGLSKSDVSKGLLPAPLEILLKKIADPEKRRRIKLGLQGKGPKLSAAERNLLLTISGITGSAQAAQVMSLVGTPDGGPEFYRHGIRKSNLESGFKREQPGMARRAAGGGLAAYGALLAPGVGSFAADRRYGLAGARAGIAGASIGGGLALIASGKRARDKAIDAKKTQKPVSKSVFARD